MQWDLQDLAFDYHPRLMWLSYPRVFYYCNLFPSQIQPLIDKYTVKNPSLVYIYSPKNYTDCAITLSEDFSNPNRFKLVTDDYGVKVAVIDRFMSPVWANYVTNNQWYLNQIKASKISKYFLLLPGVEEVFLTGSSVFEVAKPSSDLDFMVRTRPGYAWVSRFWIKLFLKITRLDVHDTWLETILTIIKISRKNHLISNELYEKYIVKIENKLWQKKQRGGLIDVGLFFEDYDEIDRLIPKETRNFMVWSALKVENTYANSLGHTHTQYGGEISYWRFSSTRQAILLLFSMTLKTISYIFSPILRLQYSFYKKRSPEYIYFIISKSLICFFPLIHKPKSLIQYKPFF